MKRKKVKKSAIPGSGYGDLGKHRCATCMNMIPVVFKFCPPCQFGKPGHMKASGPQRAGGGFVRRGG